MAKKQWVPRSYGMKKSGQSGYVKKSGAKERYDKNGKKVIVAWMVKSGVIVNYLITASKNTESVQGKNGKNYTKLVCKYSSCFGTGLTSALLSEGTGKIYVPDLFLTISPKGNYCGIIKKK